MATEEFVEALRNRCAPLVRMPSFFIHKIVLACGLGLVLAFLGFIIITFMAGGEKKPTIRLALVYKHYYEGDPVLIDVFVANSSKDAFYLYDHIPNAGSTSEGGLYLETVLAPQFPAVQQKIKPSFIHGDNYDGPSEILGLVDIAVEPSFIVDDDDRPSPFFPRLGPWKKWEKNITLQDYYKNPLPSGEYRLAYTINFACRRADAVRNPPPGRSSWLDHISVDRNGNVQVIPPRGSVSQRLLPDFISHILNTNRINLPYGPDNIIGQGELRFSIEKKDPALSK
jgi:hypothetical protein